jgi:tetrahydromethanopterin S-methyltransferase subunit G
VRKEIVDFRSDVNKRLDETNKRIEALNDSLSREISEALNRRIGTLSTY